MISAGICELANLRVVESRVLLQQFHHLLGQLRANAGFFVLEIDVRVAPVFFLFANEVGPAFDVDLGIIFSAQPHIAPIRGRNFRRGQTFGVGDTECDGKAADNPNRLLHD